MRSLTLWSVLFDSQTFFIQTLFTYKSLWAYALLCKALFTKMKIFAYDESNVAEITTALIR